MFGINQKKDRSAFGNSGGENLCDVRDFLFNIFKRRNIGKDKRGGIKMFSNFP